MNLIDINSKKLDHLYRDINWGTAGHIKFNGDFHIAQKWKPE